MLTVYVKMNYTGSCMKKPGGLPLIAVVLLTGCVSAPRALAPNHPANPDAPASIYPRAKASLMSERMPAPEPTPGAAPAGGHEDHENH